MMQRERRMRNQVRGGWLRVVRRRPWRDIDFAFGDSLTRGDFIE